MVLLGFASHKTKEGFVMASLSALSARGKSPFDVVADSSLHDPGLPFASVLDAAMIGRVFRQDEALVGQNDMIPSPRVPQGKRRTERLLNSIPVLILQSLHP